MTLPFGIDMSKTGVYQITNTANGNRYIGSSVNIWTRWKTHTSNLRNGKHHNAHLQRAWNLYSEPCFVLTPLILCERFELARYEQAYLDIFKPEYNETVDVTAPMRGMKFTEEHKAKIGNANIGNKGRRGQKNTEEHRHKISEALTGRKLSEEHREKVRIAKRGNTYRRGVKLSDETREKLRLSHIGIIPSDETRAKRSASAKANPNNSGRFVKGSAGHLGYKHTEESKKKMSESLKAHYAEMRGEL